VQEQYSPETVERLSMIAQVTKLSEIGCRDIQALSDFLGDKEYFFGNQTTILDATAHAILANFIKVPMDSPLRTKATELANLVSFSDRMTAKFYPEETKLNGSQ
jgi:glutathione S-transferase